MDILHIPKKFTKKGDLVLISKKEYDRLLAAQNDDSDTLTPAEEKAMRRAEKAFREGKTITSDELKKRLGIPRR